MKKATLLVLAASLNLSLSGCASDYVQGASVMDSRYREETHVLVQVCFPSLPNREVVGLYTAQSYGPDGKLMSYGGGGKVRSWNTVSGQPVFEDLTSRPIDLVALDVVADGSDFVFIPSRTQLTDSWSGWMSAASQNPLGIDAGAAVWYRIVHNQNFEHIAPDSNAPRVRYKTIRVADYEYPVERKRNGIVEHVPNC